jgi:hypothetical protein
MAGSSGMWPSDTGSRLTYGEDAECFPSSSRQHPPQLGDHSMAVEGNRLAESADAQLVTVRCESPVPASTIQPCQR